MLTDGSAARRGPRDLSGYNVLDQRSFDRYYDIFTDIDDGQTAINFLQGLISTPDGLDYWFGPDGTREDLAKKAAFHSAYLYWGSQGYAAESTDGWTMSLTLAGAAAMLGHMEFAGFRPPELSSAAVARFILSGSTSGAGFPRTPAGYEISRHVAIQMRYGWNGRPAFSNGGLIDAVIQHGQGSVDSQRQTIKYQYGRNYVVLSTSSPGRIVTAMIPRTFVPPISK